MSSGAWILAKPVTMACDLAMNRLISKWVDEREQSIVLRMARGRWSWRWFKDVPLTREEVKSEKNVYCIALDHIIGHPMENVEYAAMQKLLSLAVDAERIVEGAQVFVSSEDHWRISSALQTVDMDGVGFLCGVPDNGGDVQRDGEHRP